MCKELQWISFGSSSNGAAMMTSRSHSTSSCYFCGCHVSLKEKDHLLFLLESSECSSYASFSMQPLDVARHVDVRAAIEGAMSMFSVPMVATAFLDMLK